MTCVIHIASFRYLIYYMGSTSTTTATTPPASSSASAAPLSSPPAASEVEWSEGGTADGVWGSNECANNPGSKTLCRQRVGLAWSTSPNGPWTRSKESVRLYQQSGHRSTTM